MGKFIEKLKSIRAWYRSRRMRRIRRTVSAAADTASAGVGFALRLGLKAVMTVLLVLVTTGLILACIFSFYVKTTMTSERLQLTMEELSTALSSHVYAETYAGSNDWVEIATLYATENRVWKDSEEISQYVKDAAVAIEDQRFYKHKGVDWSRTVGAFVNMFVGMRNTFGGSTLTQQLIKNLTGKDDVTVQRKLLEIFQALEFEKDYTKDEILTMYLNVIYLGEGCYGVGSAAREYFDKEVSQLSLAEAATLIGITNNPSMYDPYISDWTYNNCVERRNTTLFQMYEQDYITREEYNAAKAEDLRSHLKRAEGEDRQIPVNSYYVDSLIWDVIADLAEERNITQDQASNLLYNGGYQIYTCQDMSIQRIVDNVYQNTGNLPQPYRYVGQDLNSGIVVLDARTGACVALCGGTGTKTQSLVGNYATEWRRPPGSSFKPVAVYGPAIDLGVVGPNTQVNDSPGLSLKGTTWYPTNDSYAYSGITTLRNAIAWSRNTIAAQTLDAIGLQSSWDYLTNHFGFHNLVRDHLDETTGSIVSDYAYAALALGQLSYGITCEEMAQAYTAFANNGVMSRARTYSLITDSDGKVILENPADQVMALKPNTAWMMDSILNSAISWGTGQAANFSGQALAGKTGTTSENKDRYFTGFSRYYVAACWTGYDSPEKMPFYTNPACQIWRMVMQPIHANLPYWEFETPTITGPASLGTIIATPDPSATPEPTESPEPTEEPESPPPPESPDVTDQPEGPPEAETPPPADITPVPPVETLPPVDITPEPPPQEITPVPPVDITPEPPPQEITPEPPVETQPPVDITPEPPPEFPPEPPPIIDETPEESPSPTPWPW